MTEENDHTSDSSDSDFQQEMLLQRYLDGDLSTKESIAFEAQLAESEELQVSLNRTRGLGELIRFAAEEDIELAASSESLLGDGSALLQNIERRLDSPASSIPAGVDASDSKHPRFKLIQGAKKRRNAYVGTAVVALAAALFLMVDPLGLLSPAASVPDAPIASGTTNASVDNPAIAPAGNIAEATDIVATRGSEVVAFDFGINTGTIFHVEGEEGQPLAVVWIDEEEDIL